MYFIYDGNYYLVFADGLKHAIEKDVWEKLKKLKESEAKSWRSTGPVFGCGRYDPGREDQ